MEDAVGNSIYPWHYITGQDDNGLNIINSIDFEKKFYSKKILYYFQWLSFFFNIWKISVCKRKIDAVTLNIIY